MQVNFIVLYFIEMSLLRYVLFCTIFARGRSDIVSNLSTAYVSLEKLSDITEDLTNVTEIGSLLETITDPDLILEELTSIYENYSSIIEDGDYLDTAKNPFVYLEEYNYTYENHTVVTEDGYRLLLVRIPYDRNESSSNTSTGRPAILFVHGFECSFNDFLVTGPGISFGFKAVEEGYDVFLLNVRGSRWSRSHTTLDPDLNANAFWNFSFHEMGIYDVSATIDYILNITEQSKVSYVAHSQGTNAFLVLTSTRPEYNDKITLAVLLAPVAYNGNAKWIVTVLFKYNVDLEQAAVETLHLNELLPYTAAVSETAKLICSPNSPLLWACKEFFYKSFGPSGQINDSIISAYLTNFPAGTSFKDFLHFEQNANTGGFRMYNYLGDGNLKEYGQSTPPDYNLSAITAPVAVYYGSADYLAVKVDVTKLINNLPNIVENVEISSVETNHYDVLLGTQAEELVTKPALKILNEYNSLE